LIKKRDALEQNSEICINELCTLDLSRIDETKKCTVLHSKEMEEVDMKLKRHLGISA
jgi:mRNA interferase MazF